MNQIRQLSTPITVEQKTPVPILTFEVTDVAVPVRMADNFAFQDKLRDDQDLAEAFRNIKGPTCWSALNDF